MSALAPAEARDDDEPQPLSAAASAQRQRQCLRMLGVVLASYTLDTLLLLGFARFDAIDGFVPWAYAAAGAAACGVFWVLLRSGKSEGLADPFLVVPQMLVHSAIHLGFVMWAPAIGVPLLMMLLVINAFGAMRVSRMAVLSTSALIAIGVAAVLAWGGLNVALPTGNLGQRVVSAAWFALVLARVTLLDLYGLQLRDVLMQRNAKLKAKFEKMHRRDADGDQGGRGQHRHARHPHRAEGVDDQQHHQQRHADGRHPAFPSTGWPPAARSPRPPPGA